MGIISKITGLFTKKKPQAELDIINILHGIFEESEVQDKTLHFPDWNITVIPEVQRAQETSVYFSFQITSPEWDQPLYERSMGLGENQEKATGMALGGFVFGIMDVIKQMMKDRGHVCGGCTCDICQGMLESEFVGHKHRWRVYESNIVTTNGAVEKSRSYWEMIAPEIAKRLGNQKMCYVKIFGCKFDGNITGECRINDIAIPEISKIVADYVSTWPDDKFLSQKQFFILTQDEETILPYPHTTKDIAKLTKKAISVFTECQKDDETWEQYDVRMEEQIGDKDLAQELALFLPEICAERLFPKINSNEKVLFTSSEKEIEIYKTQIASYYPIVEAVYAEFEKNNISKETLGAYVAMSATYSAIKNIPDNDSDIENDEMSLTLTFNTDDTYQLR
ncbi:hypothetical protein KD923_15120 [Escherichia fergusonii]|nr:DUF6348 family protein [Escherichia fergusonii]MCH5361508.1 hypothetical protein [Escherichia fergusonii]